MAKNGGSPRPKPNVNQPVDLSRLETWSYAIIWIGSCFYAIYTVLRYSLGKSYKLTKQEIGSSLASLRIIQLECISQFLYDIVFQIMDNI